MKFRATTGLVVVTISALVGTVRAQEYASDARDVARWLQTIAVDSPEGRAWPGDARAPDALETELGHGTAGVVLFWIGLHRADPRPEYLQEVRRGADYLVAHARKTLAPAAASEWTTGLYGPLAGVGFVLNEAFRATGDTRYRAAAMQVVDLLHAGVQRDASGAAWNQSHDVLTGAAGTGLFLLYAADQMGHAPSLTLAMDVGRKLISRGVPEPRGGLVWKGSYEARFVLPNFSHGVAGIGYFLAALHRGGDKAFLDAAIAAATYLKTVADTSDNGFRVAYGWPNPGWARPFDIGWAHGPSGTARLFHQLWLITGDEAWRGLVDRCATSLRASGLPNAMRKEYGEAVEINQRFGTAGVAQFFLDRYRRTGDQRDLTFARSLVDQILAAGSRTQSGLKWMTKRQGFMTDPGKDAEFASYFYGAAGYGLLLLNLDAAIAGREWTLRLPDDPFALSEPRRP